MRIKRLPAGFIIPAQPVVGSRPPCDADWVHEIKHDGYRMIVRWDGPTARLYSRNAHEWTAKLPAIAAAAERIKAKSFTIYGEAVVGGPVTACRDSRSYADRAGKAYACWIRNNGD
jgi:ATP-dependent DNA ligase